MGEQWSSVVKNSVSVKNCSSRWSIGNMNIHKFTILWVCPLSIAQTNFFIDYLEKGKEVSV